jgi:DNA-binding MarR family transcriptional regulator
MTSRTPKQRKKQPPAPRTPEYRQTLERTKRTSTLQLLMKAARLVDEEAVRRVSLREGAPKLRRSHTALLPHLDLDGTRISDLADRLGVSKQAVSELVDDLEAAGVVKRTPDPADARAKRVTFTPKGLEGMMSGLGVLRDFEGELAAALGERPMRQLQETLVRLLDHLQSTREKGGVEERSSATR